MDVACLILAISVCGLLLLSGLLGCIVPVIPGPALSYAAMLVLLPTRFAPSARVCVVFLAACIAVHVLDFIVPAIGAKKFECSRFGVAGCIAGTFLGMFFGGVWGLVLGPFLGGMLGEIVAGKNFAASVRGGFGAFLGFVAGVLLKVAYCVVCTVWCVSLFFK